MTVADYAVFYEREYRPRRRFRRVIARALWAGLLLVNPPLALRIWRERG